MGSAENILKQYWGYDSFRPLQKDIIDDVVSGKDVVALLPTGGGKSVIYQVAAIMQEGICLVISPLIALMQDQIKHLKEIGISAACIHSGMHYMDVKRTLENTVHGGYKLLYISPERLQSEQFLDHLGSFNINLIAVDEAHCISQWGYDFRPDYLNVVSIREQVDAPVLALTATATTAVRNDIAYKLRMKEPVLYVQSFERKNIEYDVQYSENKNGDVLTSLQSVRTSSIIYCHSRKQTEVLVKYLSQHNVDAVSYHAGMAKDKRTEAQESWTTNKTRIIVATTAFGMGINKPDVELVVHYDTPFHIEGYYQEAGRAGRNDQSAKSIVLYNNSDIKRLESSIGLQYPGEDHLRLVYQSVVEYLQVPIGVEPDTYYPFDIADFCSKFKLDAMKTSGAMKLLEQEGLWTLTEAVFKPNTVYIPISKSELEDALNTYPQYAYFITNLLRLYGSLFQYPTTIRLSTIANKVNLKTDEVGKLFIQLHQLGILEYHKPIDGPQLYFHHYRVDSKQLILDMNRINTLKKRHTERIDAMLGYLSNTTACRTNILLSYFDEHKTIDCGHCDVCLNKIGKTNTPSLNSRLLALLTEAEQPIAAIVNQLSAYDKDAVVNAIRELVDSKQLKIKDNSVSKR